MVRGAHCCLTPVAAAQRRRRGWPLQRRSGHAPISQGGCGCCEFAQMRRLLAASWVTDSRCGRAVASVAKESSRAGDARDRGVADPLVSSRPSQRRKRSCGSARARSSSTAGSSPKRPQRRCRRRYGSDGQPRPPVVPSSATRGRCVATAGRPMRLGRIVASRATMPTPKSSDEQFRTRTTSATRSPDMPHLSSADRQLLRHWAIEASPRGSRAPRGRTEQSIRARRCPLRVGLTTAADPRRCLHANAIARRVAVETALAYERGSDSGTGTGAAALRASDTVGPGGCL